MSVPQGWEHSSLLQKPEMRRVTNVCPVFGHSFFSWISPALPTGRFILLFFFFSVEPEGTSLSA